MNINTQTPEMMVCEGEVFEVVTAQKSVQVLLPSTATREEIEAALVRKANANSSARGLLQGENGWRVTQGYELYSAAVYKDISGASILSTVYDKAGNPKRALIS